MSTPRRPGKRPLIVWDVVITSILLVLLAFLSFFVSVFGAFLVMTSDSCGADDCIASLIGFGVLVAMGLPWLVLIAAVVLSMVLIVKRRVSFWLPLAAAPFVVGAWFAGAGIAALATGS